MPTYEYECGACQHRFDEMQGFHDPVLRKCPECGRLKLKRLLGSGGGIVFKGSGFYETDYKRKSSPSTAGKDSKPKPESGGKSDSSSPPAKDD